MSQLHPTRRNGRLVRLLVPLTVASLALVGCGDDDDNAASDTSTKVTETSNAATDSTTEPTAEDTGSKSGSDGDEATAAFCAVVKEVNSAEAPPTVELVEKYLEVVPQEGKAATTKILEALKAANGDFMAVMSDPEAGAAMEELTEMEGKVCGTDTGTAQDPSVGKIDPAATRVDVGMADYKFTADLPTTPGRYSFVFTNGGAEPHLAILFHLEDGATMEQVMASEGEEGVAAQFETSVTAPGADAVITADLTPGQWVLVCPIPDAKGTAHVEHGMITPFTVA